MFCPGFGELIGVSPWNYCRLEGFSWNIVEIQYSQTWQLCGNFCLTHLWWRSVGWRSEPRIIQVAWYHPAHMTCFPAIWDLALRSAHPNLRYDSGDFELRNHCHLYFWFSPTIYQHTPKKTGHDRTAQDIAIVNCIPPTYGQPREGH